jgi:uncharacterized membrane protein
MTRDRLHSLSDGIFSIAMTLLVFNLRVPAVAHPSNYLLWQALIQLAPQFLSLIMSFFVLLNYWRGHNRIVSDLAQNVDVLLTNYNALFLLFVVLLPFSAGFYGQYHNSDVGILLYGANIIAISGSLFWLRHYILKSETIQNNPGWSSDDLLNSSIRGAVPPISAALAVLVGFWNKDTALFIFTLAIIVGFSGSLTQRIRKVTRSFHK